MEFFFIIAGAASIISLFLSIFAHSRINKIKIYQTKIEEKYDNSMLNEFHLSNNHDESKDKIQKIGDDNSKVIQNQNGGIGNIQAGRDYHAD